MKTYTMTNDERQNAETDSGTSPGRMRVTSKTAPAKKAKAAAARSGPEPFRPEDPFEGLKALKDWQACWLRAIGLVWKDPRLKAELVENPHAFFAKHCGYEVIKTMQIVVEADVGSDWRYNAKNDVSWTVRPSVLKVFIPESPVNKEDWALALADFEAVSTTMPFSFTAC